MTEPFNVNEYWLERGRTYMEENRTPAAFHRLQEQFLLNVLSEGRIPMRRLLELGCGFGRITRLLATQWPRAEITALDLSPDQLANARRYCAGITSVQFQQYDFHSGAPLPGAGYDTVIAVEVFLHQPAEMLLNLMKRLATVTRHIVNIDWSEEWSGSTPEHVWVHDYPELFAEAGFQCATLPLPGKVEGKQQKLFIAAEQISPPLLALELQLRARALSLPSAAPQPDPWSQQLHQAAMELRRVIPAGATFILVDEAQWGNPRELEGYRVIPFLEREGSYFGPPTDSASAWRELRRLRQAGASHIVLAWPAFWWLQYYAEFHQQLRATCQCVLETPRVVVFALSETMPLEQP